MRLLILSCLAAIPLLGAPPDTARFKLVFSDEFEGSAVDVRKWNYRLGPRMWSEQKQENVSVGGGMLRLSLRREKAGPLDYTAGGVISKAAFQYGYYEARIKMPRGRGWHTSFWMMQNGPKQGLDDRYQEIDVCEQDSSRRNHYSVNWHSYNPHRSFGYKRVETPDLAADFHIYGAQFSPRGVQFYFDGKPVHSIDARAVPHYAQHIWLTSIASYLGETESVEDAALPETALFDWVRYYKSIDEPAPQYADLDLASRVLPAPLSARFADPGYYVWCGAMVRGDDRKYHLYYSRWLTKYGFNAWVTHSEVAHAVSDSPTGPFRHVSVVLPPRGRDFWDGLATHNPTILRAGSRYYLYYMGNTGDGKVMSTLNWTHRNNQRIGVAVAESPYGPWQRFDSPLVDVSPGQDAPDALVANNPTVMRRPDGGYLMIYKGVGRKRPLPFGGPVVHLTATADSPTGPFTKQLKPIFLALGVDFPAEDPFAWYDHSANRYYAVVKDNNGHFTKRGRSLALWQSTNGFDWGLAPNAFVSATEITWSDGRRQKLNALERPQILFTPDGRPEVLLGAVDDPSTPGESYNVQIPLRVN